MTHSIDFEALRARRAEGILYGFDAPEAADWLDDWGGLHTLDDGHPGSYDHEALATTDSVTVTLTCQCGEWSGSASADTDEEPADLFGAWEAHVYRATGRWKDTDNDRAEVEQPAERDALPSLPAAGPESVAVLLGTIERLRTAHQASSTLAEAVAGIGHIIFDELDEARAEVERLQGERDRLADEVEQLHARIEGNLHALADAFIEEGVRLASVDQLDAELSERLERLASKAKANFGGKVAA